MLEIGSFASINISYSSIARAPSSARVGYGRLEIGSFASIIISYSSIARALSPAMVGWVVGDCWLCLVLLILVPLSFGRCPRRGLGMGNFGLGSWVHHLNQGEAYIDGKIGKRKSAKDD